MDVLYWIVVILGSVAMIVVLAWIKRKMWGSEWDPNDDLKEKWKKSQDRS